MEGRPLTDFTHRTLLGKRVHRMGISSHFGLGPDGVRAAMDRGLNYFWFVKSNMDAMTEPLRERAAADRDSLFLAGGPSLGFTGGQVRRGAERMLKKLGTDHLALLQIFWVGKMSRASDGVLRAMEDLKAEGKCRGIGCSIHDRELAGRLARERKMDVLMVRYNAGHPGAEADIFPHLGEGPDKVGVVTYTSTRWGTLLQAPKGWEDRPATASECYRFAWSRPEVDVVLTGPASIAQLDENLRDMEQGPLDPQREAWMRGLGQQARESKALQAFAFEGF